MIGRILGRDRLETKFPFKYADICDHCLASATPTVSRFTALSRSLAVLMIADTCRTPRPLIHTPAIFLFDMQQSLCLREHDTLDATSPLPRQPLP